jgi:hypothetical protein
MKLIRLLTFLLYLVFALCLSASPPLRLAIQNTGGPIQWDTIGHFFENKNPPLLVVSVSFPVDPQTTLPGFPPQHIPVLLQLELPSEPGAFNQKNLDNLSQLLMTHSNISHLSLGGWEQVDDFKRLAYVIKTISLPGSRDSAQGSDRCGLL